MARTVRHDEAKKIGDPDFTILDSYDELHIGVEELSADIAEFIMENVPDWNSRKTTIQLQYTKDVYGDTIQPPLIAAQAVFSIVNDSSRWNAEITYSIYCPTTKNIDFGIISASDNNDVLADEQLIYAFGEKMANFIAEQDFSKFI